MSKSHLSPNILREFALGTLDTSALTHVVSMLRSSPEALGALSRIEDDSFMQKLRNAAVSTEGESHSVPTTTVQMPDSDSLGGVPAILTQLSDYRVVRPLGRGGMGEVFEVFNDRLNRKEALKVVHAERAESLESRQRFEQEIGILGALTGHPNIVSAHSILQVGSAVVLAMEFVDGEDLKKRVNDHGCFSIEETANVLTQIAGALIHAHKCEVVHRDIKPSNILLDRAGNAKLSDFGLGKLERNGFELTATGDRFGTPLYMAPEQLIDSGKVDIRADIYSLGCTAIFMLRGVVPSESAQFLETKFGGGIPEPFGRVLRRMIEHDPNARFQTPSDLHTALTAALGHSTPATTDISSLRTVGVAAIVSGLFEGLVGYGGTERWCPNALDVSTIKTDYINSTTLAATAVSAPLGTIVALVLMFGGVGMMYRDWSRSSLIGKLFNIVAGFRRAGTGMRWAAAALVCYIAIVIGLPCVAFAFAIPASLILDVHATEVTTTFASVGSGALVGSLLAVVMAWANRQWPDSCRRLFVLTNRQVLTFLRLRNLNDTAVGQ